MARLPHVNSFRDLIVYKKSRALAKDVFQITKLFPKEETSALTDQIRRSSRSIGAQIAEAWGKRRYEKHFVSKLTDADAEQLETQHWLETAADCGYISRQQMQLLLVQCEEIGRILGGMMSKAYKFSNPQALLREPTIQYFIESND